MPEIPTKTKDSSIETLRGIAILLVVARHSTNGYNGDIDLFQQITHYFNYITNTIRMPLFTTISGFIYALRPVTPGNSFSFLHGKSRRILLPFISVTALIILTLRYNPSFAAYPVDQPLLTTFLDAIMHPYLHMWFLFHIMIIFGIITILEKLQLLKTPARWLTTLLISFAIALIMLNPNLYHHQLNRLLYLLPFFILGCGLKRHAATLTKPQVIYPASILALIAFSLQNASFFNFIEQIPIENQLYNPFKIAASMAFMILIFRFRFHIKALSFLGKFTFSIYLFHLHGLFIANTLIASIPHTESFSSVLSQYTFAIACGILLPILIEQALLRNQYTSLFILGLSIRKQNKQTNPT